MNLKPSRTILSVTRVRAGAALNLLTLDRGGGWGQAGERGQQRVEVWHVMGVSPVKRGEVRCMDSVRVLNYIDSNCVQHLYGF